MQCTCMHVAKGESFYLYNIIGESLNKKLYDLIGHNNSQKLILHIISIHD